LKRIQAERSVLGAFGATAGALLLLVLWTRQLQWGWLVAASLVLLVAGLLCFMSLATPRRIPPLLVGALALLSLSATAAAISTWQFQRLTSDWETLLHRRQMRVGTALDRRM